MEGHDFHAEALEAMRAALEGARCHLERAAAHAARLAFLHQDAHCETAARHRQGDVCHLLSMAESCVQIGTWTAPADRRGSA